MKRQKVICVCRRCFGDCPVTTSHSTSISLSLSPETPPPSTLKQNLGSEREWTKRESCWRALFVLFFLSLSLSSPRDEQKNERERKLRARKPDGGEGGKKERYKAREQIPNVARFSPSLSCSSLAVYKKMHEWGKEKKEIQPAERARLLLTRPWYVGGHSFLVSL